MGARQKLNNIYVTIALIVAALAGLLTQSTFVFCIALVLLIITNIDSGAIRPNKRGRR